MEVDGEEVAGPSRLLLGQASDYSSLMLPDAGDQEWYDMATLQRRTRTYYETAKKQGTVRQWDQALTNLMDRLKLGHELLQAAPAEGPLPLFNPGALAADKVDYTKASKKALRGTGKKHKKNK
jgi:hypothetical protein